MNQAEMLTFTREFNNGAYPGQRFGQAFCNATGIADAALFYMRDRKRAEAHAWLYVVAYA